MMKMNVSPAIFTVWHTREYLKDKVTRAGTMFSFEIKYLHTKSNHTFMNKNQHIINYCF